MIRSCYLLSKVLELEGGEKTEGSEVECHDWGHRLLEQRAGVQQGPVPAQTHHEVNLVGQIVLGLREGHEFVLDEAEGRVVDQQGVVHH